MRLFVATAAPDRQKTDCAIVGLHEGSGALAGAAAALDSTLQGRLSRLVKRGDVRGKAGELRLVDTDGAACERVLIVGLGKKASFGRKQYRKALVAALGALAKTGTRDAVSYLAESLVAPDAYYDARLAAEAVGAALYRIPAIRSARKSPDPALKSFGIAIAEAAAESGQPSVVLDHGQAIAGGLGAHARPRQPPANVCTPTYLAQQAKELARSYKSVRTQVLEERDLKRLKMGSFLSVTNGTDEPAKLIVMRYDGGRAGQAPVALVGKGVTFDSGGISLKQPPGMDEMKFDMTGAASVFGAIKAAAEMGLQAQHRRRRPRLRKPAERPRTKPGDIVRSMSGRPSRCSTPTPKAA